MEFDHSIQQESITDLAETLASLENAQEIHNFLKDLCTPQELAALAERWRICKLLEQEQLSYRDIHAITGASLVTIGRVARFLKHEPTQGYKKALAIRKKKAKIP